METVPVVFLFLWGFVNADYACLCNYAVELPFYNGPSLKYNTEGFLYEFDCKPIYKDGLGDKKFQSIQFEHKVVYVEMSSIVAVQVCPGSVSTMDKVAPTTTIALPTSTTQTTTQTGSSTLRSIVTSMSTGSPFTRSSPLPVSVENGIPGSQTSSGYMKTAELTSSTATTSSPTAATSTKTPDVRSTSTTSTFVSSSTMSFIKPKSASITMTQYTTTPTPSTTRTATTTTPQTTTTTPTTTSTTTMPTTTTPTTTKSTTTTPTTTTPTTTSTTTTPTTTPTTTKPTTTYITTTPTTTTAMPTTTPATTTPTSIMAQCPSDWSVYKSSCYKYHTNDRTTWDVANANCVSQGAHIVFVDSDDEDIFLRSYLSNHIDTHIHDNSDTGTWIGATDRDVEGAWVWRDSYRQTDIALNYRRWYHGQPDGDDGDEDCAAMIGNKDFFWHDYECSQSMFYVCETPVNGASSKNSVTQQPANHLASCGPGWSAYRHSCYKFVTDQGRLEWNPANEYCQNRNSHLVMIESQDEDHYLANQMRSRISTDHDDDDEETGVWTAGTDVDRENTWVWRNQLRHTDKPISGYTNWYPGEPDSGDGDKEEDCVCLIGKKGFQWQDYRCRDNMYFICEKPRSIGAAFVG